jgi:catechol 2,3-dioxygenase-like lactoylglutathione lyase family enzyme
MAIHHVSLGTNDLKRAKAFYDPLVARLGLRLIKETERIIAYGLTETVFSVEKPLNGDRAIAGNGAHLAFHAGQRKTVVACYEVALANGGTD